MDGIIARLEGLVARIAGGADDGEGTPVSVSEYDNVYKNSVQPFVDACNKFEETKKLAAWTETSFKHSRNIIDAATQCKKPDADMMKFLGPIVQVITDAQIQDNRSPFYNQHKSFGEAIQCLNWLLADGPKAVVTAQLDGADFYLNKVLKEAKDKDDPAKTDMRAFVSTLKKMLSDLAQYCNDFHKTGIMWKFSGGDVKDYKAGEKASGDESKSAGPEARLEAACAALEGYVAKQGGGEDGPVCIGAYKEFYTASVEPFVAACDKIADLKAMGAEAKKAFEHVEVIVKATTECKKPSQGDFMKLLGPIVEVITKAGDLDRKSPVANQQQTFLEAVQALNFLCMEGAPKAYILGQIEAGSFYSNKVLVAAKDKDDPEKSDLRAWVKTLKELLTGLAEYAHEYFKMGLVWNAKDGIDVKDFK